MTANAKLTDDQARAVYQAKGREPAWATAKRFGVSAQHVMNIQSGLKRASATGATRIEPRTARARPKRSAIPPTDQRIEQLIENSDDPEVAGVLLEALSLRRALRFLTHDRTPGAST